MRLSYLFVGLCLAIVLSVVGPLLSAHQAWEARGDHNGSVLARLFGDGRRMFANHFFAKADAYFHHGFYPSIFDDASQLEENHMAENAQEHAPGEAEDAHEEEHALYGPPRDWIEWLVRFTGPRKHVELSGKETREILPWLKLSAELDPHSAETYAVTAYWLRTQLGKVREAEQFLREGLRENPNSYEILLELGRLIEQDQHELTHACNVYELALKRWNQREAGKPDPDRLGLEQILGALARVEEARGRLSDAVKYFERLKQVSPSPDAIQQRIDELRAKISRSEEAGSNK